ncbi:acetylglutamate kinase [Ekhidna sp.]
MKSLNIVKIGGNVIDNQDALNEFILAFSKLEGYKLLVHGGGKIATKMAENLHLKTKMIEGRRITDDHMIDVITMTYGGLINKKIVSQMQCYGINAVGLSGADGNLILSEKRSKKDDIDFGWVGDPKQVNGKWLRSLIMEELVPIIAPLTHDGKGNLLNTNADTIANVVGVALSSFFDVSINYCFELNGVLEDIHNQSTLIKDITYEKYQILKKNGVIVQGMVPKLENAFDAIQKGVKGVRIMNHRSISKLEKEYYDEFTTIH